MKKLSPLLTVIIIITSVYPVLGQHVTFTSLPGDYQLYPRDTQDSCVVEVSGTLQTPGYDSIKVVIDKDGLLWREFSQPLTYVQDTAQFRFVPKIHAELADYTFRLFVDGNMIIEADSVVCGDAFLIEGQSNAEAYGDYPFRDRWVRTFGTCSTDPREIYEDTTWYIASANLYPMWDAHVGIWGLCMGHLIVENFGIPICIINGAVGGTHITEHFKDLSNPYNLETIYGRHLYRTTKAGVKDNIKAVLWHQGEADTWLIFTHPYQQNFTRIHHDWMIDYPAVENVYIWQLRHSFYCGNSQPQLREIQRRMALHDENIKIMSTANLEGHDGLHYNADGYEQMGDWIYPLVARDYYGLTDTLDITPPEIQEIYYTSVSHDTLAMLFDQPVIWPDEPYWGEVMEDYIFLDGHPGYVLEGFTNPRNDREILLVLSESVNASLLSYTANDYYRAHWEIYEGPWIVNRRGIGALIFYEFPIESFHDRCLRLSTQSATVLNYPNSEFRISASPNPFNPTAVVSYQLPVASFVYLAVYDISGRVVAELVNGWRGAGNHEVTFDGSELASGMYILQLKAGEFSASEKIVLLK